METLLTQRTDPFLHRGKHSALPEASMSGDHAAPGRSSRPAAVTSSSAMTRPDTSNSSLAAGFGTTGTTNITNKHSLPFQMQSHFTAVNGPSAANFRSYGPPVSSPVPAAAVQSPNSQDSMTSTSSGGSGSGVGAGLGADVGASHTFASNSSGSNATFDTVMTSPTSPPSSQKQKKKDSVHQNRQSHATWNISPTHAKPSPQLYPAAKAPAQSPMRPSDRLRTPEAQVQGQQQQQQQQQHEHRHAVANGGPIGSPSQVLVSPGRQKRTASGMLKPVGSPEDAWTAAKRADSVSSSSGGSGGRVGKAAAQLKTRLAYAMAKVQNGWEKHTLSELEVMTSQLPSPRTAVSSPAVNVGLVSPRSALTNGAARLTVHDRYHANGLDDSPNPPSKRRSGSGIVSWSGGHTVIPDSPRQHTHRRIVSASGPQLAPAADIRPTSANYKYSRNRDANNSANRPSPNSRSTPQPSATHQPPSLPSPSTPKSRSAAAAAAAAATHAAHAVRSQTQTERAEEEAMHALMLIASPSNTTNFPLQPYQSSSQPNPSSHQSHTQPARPSLRRASSSGQAASSMQPSPLRSEFRGQQFGGAAASTKDANALRVPAPTAAAAAAAAGLRNTSNDTQQNQRHAYAHSHQPQGHGHGHGHGLHRAVLNRTHSSASASSSYSSSTTGASVDDMHGGGGEGGDCDGRERREVREGRERVLDEVEDSLL